MNVTTESLGTILIEAGILTVDQLEAAVRKQVGSSHRLGDVLVELGFATPENISRALARQMEVPFFELGDDFHLDRDVVTLIPEAIARKYCLMPCRKDSEFGLTIVMKDPIDIEAVDTVRALTNLEIHKAVSTGERITAAIDKFYSEAAHIERNIMDIVELEMGEDGEGASLEDYSGDADQLRLLANDAPVVRFVNLLLMEAVRDRASDIHIEPEEKEVRVRLRVDGRLREIPPPPKRLFQAIVTRIKILANMDIAERRLPLDGRFKFKVKSRIIDIRVSSIPEMFGEKIVMRVLDREALLTDMADIGFEPDMLDQLKRILKAPNGIVLLTGPTGSGKTSTLYSALNYLKNPELNIQTVEDPVEYLVPHINQMQIKPLIGLDFANSLRSILRQDPDIVMIGEIRDLETARIAMRASLTGHLVLSTLHTNDAPSAFSRLRDIGVEAYLIAATVRLLISQRLVRIICEACKETCEPKPEHLAVLANYCPDARNWTFYRGKGCNQCGRTGFLGRRGILEFLEVTPPVRAMVHQTTGDMELRNRAIELGMVTLAGDGFRKVQQGITTMEEVLAVAALDDPEVLRKSPLLHEESFWKRKIKGSA